MANNMIMMEHNCRVSLELFLVAKFCSDKYVYPCSHLISALISAYEMCRDYIDFQRMLIIILSKYYFNALDRLSSPSVGGLNNVQNTQVSTPLFLELYVIMERTYAG